MRRRGEITARLDKLEARLPTEDRATQDIQKLTQYFSAAGMTPIIAKIDERLNALEAQPSKADIGLFADAYRGVWSEGFYQRSAICTHKNSLWLALSDTSDQPDTAPNSWKMIMRRPRDGRDGKDRQ